MRSRKEEKYDPFPLYTCKCGKCFIPTTMWVYKLVPRGKKKIQYYCSYSCWRKDGGGSGKKSFDARRYR